MKINNYFVSAVIAFLLLVNIPSLRAEEDVLFGRDAMNHLKLRIEFQQPLVLEYSIFPGISGYATGEMGFHSTVFDEPTNDFYQVSTDSDFRLILLAKDPGMEVWNDHGSGFMNLGESFYVGQAPFDTHPIWNLVDGYYTNSYSLTLKLKDLNEIYPDSDPFVLNFTAEKPPELHISTNDKSSVVLSWPLEFSAWTLEQSTVPNALSTNWISISKPYQTNLTQYSVVTPTTSGNMFFRLHKL